MCLHVAELIFVLEEMLNAEPNEANRQQSNSLKPDVSVQSSDQVTSSSSLSLICLILLLQLTRLKFIMNVRPGMSRKLVRKFKADLRNEFGKEIRPSCM